MSSLERSDTEAFSDDFEINYFDNSDYSLEENNGLLFLKHVDAYVEYFAVNINVKMKKMMEIKII